CSTEAASVSGCISCVLLCSSFKVLSISFGLYISSFPFPEIFIFIQMVCILGHPLGSFRPPRCDFIMPVQCDRCVKTILCFPDNLQKNPCIPCANILFWFC